MRRLNLWLVLLLPVLLRADLEPSVSRSRPVGRFEVLVIYPEDRPQPSTQDFDTGLRRQLAKELGEEVDIYTEFLGLDRFPGQEQEQDMARHFAQRYAARPPQIIVAAGMRALQFVRQYRGRELPDIPVVFGGLRSVVYKPVAGQAEYGVTMELATRPTVELMLRLHPDLQEVVVVSGASFMDGKIEAATRAELAPLGERVRLRYWSGLPLPDLLNRVRKLPPHTAIFFLSCFSDGRGIAYTSNQVARPVCNASPVPVYGFSSTYLGR